MTSEYNMLRRAGFFVASYGGRTIEGIEAMDFSKTSHFLKFGVFGAVGESLQGQFELQREYNGEALPDIFPFIAGTAGVVWALTGMVDWPLLILSGMAGVLSSSATITDAMLTHAPFDGLADGGLTLQFIRYHDGIAMPYFSGLNSDAEPGPGEPLNCSLIVPSEWVNVGDQFQFLAEMRVSVQLDLGVDRSGNVGHQSNVHAVGHFSCPTMDNIDYRYMK